MDSVKTILKETFASLKIYNYRLYFIGQIISFTGTWVQVIAQSWLVLSMTGSGTALGIVIALQFLPILFFGAYGGVITDRFPKRKIIYFTQSAAAGLAIILGALVATGVVELWMVYVLALCLGFVNVIDNPARHSFVFEMVGGENLNNAITLNSTVIALGRIVGPALAGIFIKLFGLAPCFFINGFSFLAVLAVLFLMRPKELLSVPPSRFIKGQLKEGLKYIKTSPVLKNALLMMMIIGTFTFEFNVSLPLLAKFTFGGGAGTLAALSSAMGAGSVLAVFAVARIKKVSSRRLIISALFLGISTLLASISTNIYLALVAMALVGYFSANFIPLSNSILQIQSAPAMRGRVISLWSVAFLGSTPIGGPIIGWIGEFIGARFSLAIGGLAAIFAAGLSYKMLSRSMAAEAKTAAGETENKIIDEEEVTEFSPRV